MWKVYARARRVSVLVSLAFVGTVPNGKSNTIISTSNHKRHVWLCVCVCVCAPKCAHVLVRTCAARTPLSSLLYILPEEMLGLLQNSHKSKTYSRVYAFFLFFYHSFVAQGRSCLAEDWVLLGRLRPLWWDPWRLTNKLSHFYNSLLTVWDERVWFHVFQILPTLLLFCSRLVLIQLI